MTVELLWDILREMGLLGRKKNRKKREKTPPGNTGCGPRRRSPEEAGQHQRRAIAGSDPAEVARAIKRMIRKD